MKINKKIFAVLLIFAMIFSCIQIGGVNASAADTQTDTVYLRFRYERKDNDYEDTKLVFYDDDSSKSNNVIEEVELNHKDDQGVFAVVKKSKTDKLYYNFVKSGKKVFDDNQVYDSNDYKEDYEILTSIKEQGKPGTECTKIDKDNAITQVNLHYYRYDQNYEDWDDVWTWITDKGGHAVITNDAPFIGDKQGKLCTIQTGSVPTGSDVYFIIRKGGDTWAGKDTDLNRTINKAYANKDGVVDAYVVSGEEEVYYNESDVNLSPKIYAARIDSLNDISIKTNLPMDEDELQGKITLKCGDQEIGLSGFTVDASKTNATIKSDEKLDMGKNYTLSVEGFGSKDLTLGKIYNSKDYADLYTYTGDLGAVYSKDSTSFTLWSPSAESVKLALYGKDGNVLNNDPESTVDMAKGENGSWTCTQSGDLNGEFYNYLVTINGKTNVVVDPYAKAVSANGIRGMVVDLSKTNPEGWSVDKKPELKDPTDSVIYEMHIRDFTSAENSGAKLEYRGKFKGVWQDKTTIPGTDVKTGVDHLKELGVNTVHLMPSFDYNSVDETKPELNQFNWGYDPQNYNVPEGSYSTDPYTGTMRISEFKEMVKALHDAGIRVVMDVVYNHTALSSDSNLNLAMPDYYYRQDDNFNFSNGSGCGNELASDRTMVRRLIVDSVNYWATEYHIDGFRFDLMGCLDVETMKQIRTDLDKIDKSILVYGEGWTGGSSSLDSSEAALKANTPKFGEMQIAAFSDDIRDGIKGSVFDKKPGFVSGASDMEETIKFGVIASTKNDQIDNTKVRNGQQPWANEPYQTITYASAHDNNTLYDRLKISCPDASEEEILKMNKMSAAIVYTSQGIPFMQAGEEIARTKVNADGTFNDNSYNSPDSVNQIDWNRKVQYNNLFDYYKGLIELRKDHKVFRMNTTEDIQNSIKFLEPDDKNVVAYTLDGSKVNDTYKNMAVIFNANTKETKVTLPSENWVLIVNGDTAGTSKIEDISGTEVTIPARTSYVLVDRESYYAVHPDEKVDPSDEETSTSTPGEATETPNNDKKPNGGNSDNKIPSATEYEPKSDTKIPDQDSSESNNNGKPATETVATGTNTATSTNDGTQDGSKEDSSDSSNVIALLLFATMSSAFVLKKRLCKNR